MILSEEEILSATKVVPAIYKITNVVNGKYYVGSTKDYRDRRIHHFSDLRGNRHSSARLQNAFNKYGEDSFKIEMITPVVPDELLMMEQMYIDLMDATNRNTGYNIAPIAGRTSHSGWHHTDEAKQRIGDSNRGKVRTDLARANMSAAQKRLFASGYVHPNKGKRPSDEQIENSAVKKRRPVIQLDIEGKLMQRFPSVRAAAIGTEANATVISLCCRGVLKTAGGFRWEWA